MSSSDTSTELGSQYNLVGTSVDSSVGKHYHPVVGTHLLLAAAGSPGNLGTIVVGKHFAGSHSVVARPVAGNLCRCLKMNVISGHHIHSYWIHHFCNCFHHSCNHHYSLGKNHHPTKTCQNSCSDFELKYIQNLIIYTIKVKIFFGQSV